MRALCRYVRCFAIAWVVAIANGCASTHPPVPTYPAPRSVTTANRDTLPSRPTPDGDPIRTIAANERVTLDSQTDLDTLLALARKHNPDLAAAAAKIEEARGHMIQAGLYPNPIVGYSGNQINDGPGTAGQQGGFIEQDFVTGGKLKIAREAARFGVSAADWHAASKWFDTVVRVKSAYYEYVTARASQGETERMAARFAEAQGRTEKLAFGGRVDAYDLSRLKVELLQVTNRVGAARQRLAAAERMLTLAVGVDRLAGGVSAIALTESAKVPAFDEAVKLVGQSSFMLAVSAEAEQTRLEVRQAELKPIPNVKTLTTVAHDYVTRAPMASVMVGVPLPVWDRNEGNLAAAQARLAASIAGVEQTRLRQVERLAIAYQKYENARRQLELYRTRVLPDAATALEQIERVYALKGERFFDTLDALRVLTQARVDYTQFFGDLWTAVAEIEAVTQVALAK